MMKIVQINSVYGVGSTGRIAMDLQDYLNAHGIETRTIYGYGKSKFMNTFKMQSILELKINIALGRITGHHGNYNYLPTIRALNYLKKEKPDIIHLHNIHGYYINVPMLIRYIKRNNIPVVWTFHDCWPFTGHCCYFDDIRCDKWKNGCNNCPNWGDEYSILLGDRSRQNWKEKKEMFSKLSYCILVSPSRWLANYLTKSFLKNYRITVVHNGININVFKPTNNSIKKELNIEGKTMILGIVPNLDGPKGGKYLIQLAKKLGRNYAVVILSLKTKDNLPNNVHVLPYTSDIKRIAKIYSAADVFVNTTLNDNYPTVNLESIACGTPVVTFKTGGSPEGIIGGFGSSVKKFDMNNLCKEVIKWSNKKNVCRPTKMQLTGISKEYFAERYLDIYNIIKEKKNA